MGWVMDVGEWLVVGEGPGGKKPTGKGAKEVGGWAGMRIRNEKKRARTAERRGGR